MFKSSCFNWIYFYKSLNASAVSELRKYDFALNKYASGLELSFSMTMFKS